MEASPKETRRALGQKGVQGPKKTSEWISVQSGGVENEMGRKTPHHQPSSQLLGALRAPALKKELGSMDPLEVHLASLRIWGRAASILVSKATVQSIAFDKITITPCQ